MHAFLNDLERPVGTYLFGRRMYEVLLVWETLDLAEQLSLSDEEIARLEEPYVPHPVSGTEL